MASVIHAGRRSQARARRTVRYTAAEQSCESRCKSSGCPSAERQDGSDERPVDVEVEPPLEHVIERTPPRCATTGRRPRRRPGHPRAPAPAPRRRSGWRFRRAEHGQRLSSFLAKDVERMCLATGPLPRRGRRLREDHAGDARVVARCEEHGPPVVAQVLAGPCRRPRALVRDDLRRPVLPQTSLPGICATRAVPPALTTIHSPSRIACSISGFISTRDCGGGTGKSFHPCAVVFRLGEVRRDADPPLASVEM